MDSSIFSLSSRGYSLEIYIFPAIKAAPNILDTACHVAAGTQNILEWCCACLPSYL